MTNPRFIGTFAATRPDGNPFEFAAHEISFSADGIRIYAGVNASKGGDLNRGIETLPPNRKTLGVDGGGIYILDNSDISEGRSNPKLRLVSAVPRGGGHSVVPANINGVPHLVGGAELGACRGTWPRITNIADEKAPFIVGEFRLAMNYPENCPEPTPSEGTSGIVPPPGAAALHYNDVDSARDTRPGLFRFLWAGLRIVDLRNPANPVEIAYFKPGDACGGHVRYIPESGLIWLTRGQSGFYVLELQPELRGASNLSSRSNE